MSFREDQDIDVLLRQSGEQWRAGIMPKRNIDPAWFRSTGSSGRILHITSLAAGAIVVVVGFAFATQMLPHGGVAPQYSQSVGAGPTATASSGPSQSRAPTAPPVQPSHPFSPAPTRPLSVVMVGDRVTASGNVIVRDNGIPHVCRALFFVDSNPGCENRVAVEHLDARGLPGAESNSWFISEYVTVVGTWTGEAIHAITVEPGQAPPKPASSRYVPCAEPIGGWPGTGVDLDEAATNLTIWVNERPGNYVGRWWAEIADNAGITTGYALVVGTVGDVRSAYEELGSIYPYNLCVVAVEFSALELRELGDQLTSQDPRWQVALEPPIDRLKVVTPVFDPALAAAIASHTDMVFVDSMAALAN